MEVTKAMPREARHDTQEALYSLIAGAEGCGSAARSARLVQRAIARSYEDFSPPDTPSLTWFEISARHSSLL